MKIVSKNKAILINIVNNISNIPSLFTVGSLGGALGGTNCLFSTSGQ